MFLIWSRFYDKFGNFDNRKFLELLNKARRQKLNWEKKSGLWKTELILFKHVWRKDLWKFINKFSIFINSWVDVKSALNILIKQTKSPYFKKIITEIRDNINHGIGISETMFRYTNVFDPLTIALIWVGEKTWLLWKILQELDQNMLDSIELRWRIKSAMVYPAIMVFLTIGMLIFMMVFIVPKITSAFWNAGVTMPWLTEMIVAVSNFMIHEWLKLIWIIFLIFIIHKVIKMTYRWRMVYAKIAMNLPVFWYIVKMSNIVYFIKSFTILLDSGILLLESIKTSSKVVPNLAYKKEVIRIKNEIEFGLTISKSLWLNLDYEESVYLNPYFPEDFAYVVNTWEETGSISNSLKKIWLNYDIDLKRYIWNLSTLMEPMIIVFIGGMVGTIVIGIMLPFFQLWKVVQNM